MANIQKYSNLANQFGFRLLMSLPDAREPGKNTVISPFSIHEALTIVMNGAEGETQKQMWKALNLESLSSLDEINQMAANCTKFLEQNTGSNILTIANSIWIASKYQLIEEYAKAVKGCYNADVFPLTTADVVNNWCNEHTKGKIPKIFTSPLSNNDKMVVANAIYFKGMFTQAFDEKLTQVSKFHSSAGELDVQMMSQHRSYHYKKSSKYQACQIEYMHGNSEPEFISTVILPHDQSNSAMDQLIELMTKEPREFTDGFRSLEGTLKMPKFNIQYGTQLNDVLIKLGMEKAFHDTAEFGKLTRPGDLMIGNVVHKCVLEVNEKGAEAAAVTAVKLKIRAVVHKETFDMTCDRPFLFVIQEKSSNTILFIGRIENPSTASFA